MRVEHVLPDDRVNIPKGSPFMGALALLIKLAVIVFTVYILLGLAVNVTITRIPPGFEKALEKHMLSGYAPISLREDPERAERVLQEIVPDEYRDIVAVYVVNEETVNALAVPGFNIIIYRGLLDITDDDELAFVLAHELGHHHYRHNLKVMGRKLAGSIILNLLMGGDSADSMAAMISGTDLVYSRHYEKQADLYAVNLLHDRGRVFSGALSFMKKIQADYSAGEKLMLYFSTHPNPDTRIKYMEEEIAEMRDIAR